MFDKGSSETKTSVEWPEYINQAQKIGYGLGAGMTLPFASQMPKHTVAGMTEDQLMGGNLARRSAMQAFNTDYSGRIMDAGGGYDAAQITGDGIKSLLNPYLQSVGKGTLAEMRREKMANDAEIGARNASSVAFGGSGPAIERGQLNRAHGESVGRTIQSLLSGGWDRASNLAAQNAQMKNNARQFSAGQGLNAAIGAQNAFNSNITNQQDTLRTLLNYGTFQQNQAQRSLDAPWNNLQKFMSLFPREQGTSVQSQPMYWNPIEAALGAASLPIF